MANIYYLVMDLSRDREDPKQMSFEYCGYNNDLTRSLRVIAERNGSRLEDLRLFVYPTKKEWEGVRTAFIHRADWHRA